MNSQTTIEITHRSPWQGAIDRAVRAIPPAWPLASSVAVNPFLGQAEETLAVAGARLRRAAGAPITMPRSWYRAKIAAGAISDDDLRTALASGPSELQSLGISGLKAEASTPAPLVEALPTVADLAAVSSGIDWPNFIATRIGVWAADYFDAGQALWAAPKAQGAYRAWRATALHDLSPEIAGLSDFAQHVSDAPESADAAIAWAADRLGLEGAAGPSFFHQLLMTLGGWAQYARYLLWEAELSGLGDDTARDLLAIRLVWEEALFARYGDRFPERWREVLKTHAEPIRPTRDQLVDTLLQAAAERGEQRRLAMLLADDSQAFAEVRPAVQAAFCIDVRSEVFRRALEGLDPSIKTLGFAGFFGLATAHRALASDVVEKRLPVLLNPALASRAGDDAFDATDFANRIAARATRAWGRFKLAAVSSFAFVEATAPVYAAKLLADALGHSSGTALGDPRPEFDPRPPLTARLDAAEGVLRAMSLTDNFAPVVVLASHGAKAVNNPHASTLQCGACGGYPGDVNARLLAGLLNDREVRLGLVGRGIVIPSDTLFIAALHDTTADKVTLFDRDYLSPDHLVALEQIERWFAVAGRIARTERAQRLPRARDQGSIEKRGRDWSETRAEWGLAGCHAFIAAPRRRTRGRPLAGKAFLHDYDWTKDNGFSVLELILTAPVVVASWINLQYYGSTVAPDVFGAGDKLLHNVVGGIGVVEGNGGILRAGLPWQSVFDGESYAHDPLRLSVCIEAPRDAIADILARHPDVAALFDNGWMHLFALNEEGQMAWRYLRPLRWEPFHATTAQVG